MWNATPKAIYSKIVTLEKLQSLHSTDVKAATEMGGNEKENEQLWAERQERDELFWWGWDDHYTIKDGVNDF